jgi:DNA polymerase III epsilon subunit-like protein
MTRLCFIDTETTSLRPDRRAWEVGLIVREPGVADVEHYWFIDEDDLDLGNADPASLRIGRFYERHPQYWLDRESAGTDTESEYDVLRLVEAITRGAHLVGAVPNFDADVLGARMRANGICPSWHYHLCDVENLAVGWLSAYAATLERELGESERAEELRRIAAPPWNSDELSRAVGVEPHEDSRHTALGDARWARDIYDAVTGHA